MRIKGVDTSESTGISNDRAKFTLNCCNRNNQLSYKNFRTPFVLEPTSAFQRDYFSIFTNVNDQYTSRDNSVYQQYFYDEDGELGIPGLAKPTASVFADTVTLDSSKGYCYTMEMIKNTIDVYPIELTKGYNIIDDDIFNTVYRSAKNAEAYNNVQFAVSYSNAYTESGMTKFIMTNRNLHNFIVVEDIPTNGRYEYVNIYIKYGTMDSFQLLFKASVDDLQNPLKHYNCPISLKSDGRFMNKAYRLNLVCSYDTFRYFKNGDRSTGGRDIAPTSPEDDEEVIEARENNLTSSGGGLTALFYTGLYQFADEELMNYSWFVTNNVKAISPTYFTETQTFLSTDDYDELTTRNQAVLDDLSSSADFVADAQSQTPYVTYKTGCFDWTTGTLTDTVKANVQRYKTNVLYEEYTDKDELDSDVYEKGAWTLNKFCYGTKLKDQKSVTTRTWQAYDCMYGIEGYSYDSAKRPLQPNRNIKGTLYIQYHKMNDDGEWVFVDYSVVELASHGEMYTHMSFAGLVTRYAQYDENWKVSIWYTKNTDSETEDTVYYWMIFEDSAKRIFERDGESCGGSGFGGGMNYLNELHYPDYADRKPYRYGYAPYRGDAAMGGTLSVWLDIGELLNFKSAPASYLDENIGTADSVSIAETETTNLEEIIMSDDSKSNTDYLYIKDGVRIEGGDLIHRNYTRHMCFYDGRLWLTTRDKEDDSSNLIDREFSDLYYSQQGYPEQVLESNYRGYDSHITGLIEFDETLFVFENDRTNVVRKQMSREVNGIIEPTYQFYKMFDKGAIEFSIKEYEGAMYFTNETGIYRYSSEGLAKVSHNIDRLFDSEFITKDTFDYAEIDSNFYIITLREDEYIPFTEFHTFGASREENTLEQLRNINNTNNYYSLPQDMMYVQYIACDLKTGEFWFGNNEIDRFVYSTKDYPNRNDYENVSTVKQLKRLSVDYDATTDTRWSNAFYVMQIKDRHTPITLFPFPSVGENRRPVRRTLKGYRSFTYGLMFIGREDTIIYDFNRIENGR